MRTRAKAYPTDELGALYPWLHNIAKWLKKDIDGCWHPSHTLSPAELLGKIEALAIVEFAAETISGNLHREQEKRLKESIASREERNGKEV